MLQEEKDARSIKHLLNELAEETTDLVRQEAALARAETNEKIQQASRAMKMLVVGGAIIVAGLFYLLDAVVYGLARVLPEEYRLWLAALIVGLTVLIIGAILVKSASTKLKPDHLKPERSTHSIQRDIKLARGHMQ